MSADQAGRSGPGESHADPLLRYGSFIFPTPGNGGTLGNEAKRRPSQPPNGASGSASEAGMMDGVNRTSSVVPPENTASPLDLKARRRGATPESWLPPGWTVEDRVRTSGATAGSVDRYYYDPTGRRFRSKNEVMYFLEHGTLSKKSKRMESLDPSESQGGGKDNKPAKKAQASFNFDFLDAPEKISWVLTNASEESWTPFVGDKKVPESSSQDWAAAFTMFTTTRNGEHITF